MKRTTHFLTLTLLLLLTISLNTLHAQLDLELRLEAEKLALNEGEQGKFTFIVDNVGSVDAADVVVLFSLPAVEFVGMDATSSAYFAEIKAGESASFEVELISRVPFLRFYAEIVNGSSGDIDSNELNIDRCRALAACTDGGDDCIYDLCTLEDDEVIYPMPVDLEILTASCPLEFPTQGESLTYELSIRNNASTASPPTVLGLFQYPQAVYTPIDPAPHKQSEATIPSIAAGATETVTLVFTYNPFQEDDFNYAGGTAFSFASDGSSRDFEVDIACQKFTTDVAIVAIAEPATFGDDEIMNYRVEVINNGDEVARALRVQYANEMGGFQNSFDGQVLSVETTFPGSSFFQRNNLNAGTSERFWDIDRLEVGETAILNVSFQIRGDIVEQFIDSYSIDVLLFSDFLNDTNSENNRASVDFNRLTDFVDLELRMTSTRNPLAIYEPNTVILTLANTGTLPATNIEVDLDLSEREQAVLVGNFEALASVGLFKHVPSLWQIDELGAGEEATLEVQYFPLVENYVPYAQVTAMAEDDIDSSPGNGVCCTPSEDDEASVSVGVFAAPTYSNASNTQFQVFPNPTEDILQIKGSYEAATPYIIYDLLGKALQQGQLGDGALNVQQLPSGTYFLKIEAKQVSPIRFVKL